MLLDLGRKICRSCDL